MHKLTKITLLQTPQKSQTRRVDETALNFASMYPEKNVGTMLTFPGASAAAKLQAV